MPSVTLPQLQCSTFILSHSHHVVMAFISSPVQQSLNTLVFLVQLV